MRIHKTPMKKVTITTRKKGIETVKKTIHPRQLPTQKYTTFHYEGDEA